MKTRELIAKLQNEDPEAQVVVCSMRDTVLGFPCEHLDVHSNAYLSAVVITAELDNEGAA